MEAAEALKKLAEQAAAAGKSITEFALIQVRSLINRINAQIETINTQFGIPKTSPAPSGPGNGPNIAGFAMDSAAKFTQTNPLAGTYYGETGRDMPSYLSSSNVTVNIDATSMVDSDRMVDVVQNAFLTIQRQGGSTVPAGAY
jgi:hypothetical protein